MEFFSVNGKRPVRLCEKTRAFAFESLNHKYGQMAMKTPYVTMDDYEGFENLTHAQMYDACIERIVKQAPIRICDGEKLSGSATLGLSICHSIPAKYKGDIIASSISHLTIDFETVLKKGINGIKKDAERSLEKYKGTEREPFVRSCLHIINCMKIWHERYLCELQNMPQYKDNYNNLKNVPFGTPKNFYEAVQSLWFTFAFVRLCGNWPGIGRIDWLLGDYLKKDLSEGVLTIDEAREILAHFFIKGCEWICGGNFGSGDAQHYQNIVLAGVDEDGNEVTNEVTYLVLDILEELNISDFPTTVRINKNTDKKLLSRVAEVVRYGGGVIAIYNEDLVIESLVDSGYELREARKFANDGCWEIQVPGKTFFTYQPFDALSILQKDTLKNYDGSAIFEDFGLLYQKYIQDLTKKVEALAKDNIINKFAKSAVPARDWRWLKAMPCTVVSIFEEGCIEKGLSYLEGGPVYNVISPHIGGLPDAANSLYAIKKLVFDDKKISFEELMFALKNNWEGYETLRLYAATKYNYFGNDNDEVDLIVADIVDKFADACDIVDKKSPYKTPGGISTFGRQIEWAHERTATPSGKKAHEVLSANFSAAPGTDKNGATSVIKSYCKANLKRMGSGAALDIKLLPSAVNGEKGIETLSSLIKGFVALGGHFMQLDIADVELLKAAQENPENYQTLSVRVSGWNARFVTLDRQWQDMVINERGKEI